MKHGRTDYNTIQDITVAAQLATLVLYGGDSINKAAAARQLACEVLGLETRARYHDVPLLPEDAAQLKVPWNEPVFLLRAQDILSAETVRAWIELARTMGLPEDILRKVQLHANLMDKWPKKKLPDFPPHVLDAESSKRFSGSVR